jgi:hypothetical protein
VRRRGAVREKRISQREDEQWERRGAVREKRYNEREEVQ